jgi:hypothetical protein
LRKFSRWMPPLRPELYPPVSITGWIVLTTLAGGILAAIVAAFVKNPVLGGIIFLFPLLLMIVGNAFNRYDRRLADERKGEDIGTFARAFARRSEPFDPWVVRATWDALQRYMRFPLRPTDRLGDILSIEPLEFDALNDEVAERTGHSLDNLEANPCYARISKFDDATVRDFVSFISCQPRITKHIDGPSCQERET